MAELSLGDRMKQYERLHETKINPYDYFIIRLDGKSFSKYTKNFLKPFDENFSKAMVNTMNDLMNEFLPKTGYTHSDEISLVFDKSCTKDEFDSNTNKTTHLYNGRIIKICTLIASYCSVRFNHHMNELIINKNYCETLVNKVKNYTAVFDARAIIFNENNKHELCNYFIWRSLYDSYRNAISSYGRQYFNKKDLHKKHAGDIIQMLKEKNIHIENIPIHHLYGVYGKKKTIKKEIIIDDKIENYDRQTIINKSFKIICNEEFCDLLLHKTWN